MERNGIFKSYSKVLCIETSIFLGSMLKFKGVPAEFKVTLGSRLQRILSPGMVLMFNVYTGYPKYQELPADI